MDTGLAAPWTEKHDDKEEEEDEDEEEERSLEIRRRPRRRNPLRRVEDPPRTPPDRPKSSSRARSAPFSPGPFGSAAPSPQKPPGGSTPPAWADSGHEAAAAARPRGAGSPLPRHQSPLTDHSAPGRYRGVTTPVRSRRGFNRSRPVPAAGREPPPNPSSPGPEDLAWDDPFGFAAAERALRRTSRQRSPALRSKANDSGRPQKLVDARVAVEDAAAASSPPPTIPPSGSPRSLGGKETPPLITEVSRQDNPSAENSLGEAENVAPPRGMQARRRTRGRKTDRDGAPDEAQLTSLDYVAMLPGRKRTPPAARKRRAGRSPRKRIGRETAKKAEREVTPRQPGGDQDAPARGVSREGRGHRRRERQVGSRVAAAEPAQRSPDEERGATARLESERKRKHFQEIDRFQLEEELVV